LSWQAIDNQIITQFQTNYEIKKRYFPHLFHVKTACNQRQMSACSTS